MCQNTGGTGGEKRLGESYSPSRRARTYQEKRVVYFLLTSLPVRVRGGAQILLLEHRIEVVLF